MCAYSAHIIIGYSIDMPTKKELYRIAKEKKAGKCPKISKFTKAQLAAFISSEPVPKTGASKTGASKRRGKFVDPYLEKKLREIKRLSGKFGGPQEARAKKAIEKVVDQVHNNSPFGDSFLPWSTNTPSNRTRKLINKASIRKLKNNDLATINIVAERLDLPAAKMSLFEEVADERGLYKYLSDL